MALPPGVLDPNYLLQDLRVGIWLVAIAFLIQFSIKFFSRSNRADNKKQRKFFLGIALFFLLYTCSRIFLMISDYSYLHVNYQPIIETYFGINWEGGFYYQIFWRIGTIIGLIGFINFVFFIEFYLLDKKTKLIFSIFGVVFLCLTILFGQVMIQTIFNIGIAIIGAFPILLYAYYANITEGEMKKRASLATLGLGLSFLGIAFDGQMMQDIFYPLNIPIKIIGVSIIIIGLIIFNQTYSYQDFK
ncbi:MAG: hypothetical protein ACTSVY_16415 [Candidatus Helarchaeota archaeon]